MATIDDRGGAHPVQTLPATWDFASRIVATCDPAGSSTALPLLSKDAAGMYYSRHLGLAARVTQPVVHKRASVAGLPGAPSRSPVAALLDCYDAWAHAVDDFAPVHDPLDSRRCPGSRRPRLLIVLVHDVSPVFYPVADRPGGLRRRRRVIGWSGPIRSSTICDFDRGTATQAVAACLAFEHDYIGVPGRRPPIHNECASTARSNSRPAVQR